MKLPSSQNNLAGFFFTAIAGTLLHFLYSWSGKSPVIAAFSAVNESVWEHMKLLAMPVLCFTLLERLFLGKPQAGFWAVRAVSTLAGLLLIPVLFYTYSGALGFHIPLVDIAIFFLAAGAVFLLDTALHKKNSLTKPWQQAAGIVILVLIAAAFVLLTYYPVELALWADPNTHTYGIMP